MARWMADRAVEGSAIVSDGRQSDTGPSRWSSRDPFRTSFANWPKRTSNYTARCRGRKVNCAAGEKARARISNVMTSPAIPDADRIMATMMNW